MNLENSSRDEVVIVSHGYRSGGTSTASYILGKIKERSIADFILRLDGRSDSGPPYYYRFVKNRAGDCAKNVMTYSSFFNNLISVCPSIYLDDDLLGARLVIGTDADLLVFKMLSISAGT